jgi:hypothetical protein
MAYMAGRMEKAAVLEENKYTVLQKYTQFCLFLL